MIFNDIDKYASEKGIYQILNKVNGKIYIGQALEGFQRRYWHHQWCLKTNCHCNHYLQHAWNKYGEKNFEFSVVHILQNNESIDELEKQYIIAMKSMFHEHGYNMQSGGQPKQLHRFHSAESRKIIGQKNRQHMLGRKLSEETREKMRKSSQHKGPSEEGRQRISSYMSNRIITDETKAKLRNANIGSRAPVAKLHERDVIQIKLMLHAGIKQAIIADQYNVSLGAISAIANNRTWTHVQI